MRCRFAAPVFSLRVSGDWGLLVEPRKILCNVADFIIDLASGMPR
jgi:hypothetical protein